MLNQRVSAYTGIDSDIIAEFCEILECKLEGKPERFTATGSDRNKATERRFRVRLRKIELTFIHNSTELELKVTSLFGKVRHVVAAEVYADGMLLEKVASKPSVSLIGLKRATDTVTHRPDAETGVVVKDEGSPAVSESMIGYIPLDKARKLADAEDLLIVFYTKHGHFKQTVATAHSLKPVVNLAALFEQELK